MEGSPIAKGSGGPRKIIYETIKRDLYFNGLNVNIIYKRILWRRLNHIADPSSGTKHSCSCCCCCCWYSYLIWCRKTELQWNSYSIID